VGNPNSGKTTLFNLLTGLNQKTANYPGVTVTVKTGVMNIWNPDSGARETIEIMDLPGLYSPEPISEDERQAIEPILRLSASADKSNTLILFVADTCNPSRSLHLFFFIRSLGFKTVLLLNMASMAEEKGILPDLKKMKEDLPGVPVIVSEKSRGKTAHRIREALRGFHGITAETAKNDQPYDAFIGEATKKEKEWFHFKKADKKALFRKKADRIIMHPLWGVLIFAAIVFLIFQSLFTLSAYPMDWIDGLMSQIALASAAWLPENELSGLITDGLIPGITGILIFIPQIAFLFLFIAIMEESGYLSRVTFLADHFMRKFGLNGKSLIPFAGGAACAVPAILSARTIANRRERLITILVTPWISCSARLPVFVTLTAIFVPEGFTGPFSTRGLVLAGFYLGGIMAVFAGAALLNSWLKKEKDKSFFLMEFPEYRWPSAKTIFREVWEKVNDFVLNAGKIILAISVLLYVLASYGPAQDMQALRRTYAESHPGENPENIAEFQTKKLEISFAGKIGKMIEPVIRPLGFDWKIGIGLITSFAAREVFVGTMNTLYGIESNNEGEKLAQVLASQKDAETGRKRFDAATSLSLMVFFLLAMQCMSTFAVVKRETGSLKTALFQLLIMTGTAYLASFICYQLLS
jgi:ferrous iron transport protein B